MLRFAFTKPPRLHAAPRRTAHAQNRRGGTSACTGPRMCSQTRYMSENLSSSLRRKQGCSSGFPSGFALGISLGAPLLPWEASDLPKGKSEYPWDHPRVNFSRQPLRTFHYLSDFSRDATNWTSSCPCDKFMSKCAPPAGACAAGQCMHRRRFCACAVRRGAAWLREGLVNANLSKYYSVYLEKHQGS